MIDLEAVRQLQVEKIEREIAVRRKDNLAAQESFSDKHKQKLIDAQIDREKAEEGLPEVLKNIESRIKDNINVGSSTYVYSFSWTVRDTHTVKLLLDILPLHGYVCRLKEGTLEVSW